MGPGAREGPRGSASSSSHRAAGSFSAGMGGQGLHLGCVAGGAGVLDTVGILQY